MKSNKLQKLLDSHQHGWTLEQPFYLDTDIFNAEMKNIWKKYWLFAGTIAEIPKPGDTDNLELSDSLVYVDPTGDTYCLGCAHPSGIPTVSETPAPSAMLTPAQTQPTTEPPKDKGPKPKE